jgi:hypothetical protein
MNIGLDPAGPAFYSSDIKLQGKTNKAKLGKDDAIFVDVIHSNMGQLGITEHLGHANFLPNGGASQPFCDKKEDAVGTFLEKIAGSFTSVFD